MAPWISEVLNSEFKYVILVFLLFILPRILIRFGLPLAVTALFLGVGAQYWGIGELISGPGLRMFSIIGISSLFLFAGLEVDLGDIKQNWKPLSEHVLTGVFTIVLVCLVAIFAFKVTYSNTAIVIMALALLTPSAGIILDSLPSFNLAPDQAFWIKNKAIATEILALGILFFSTQSASATQLITSSVLLVLTILFLPWILGSTFRFVSKHVVDSEFGYLILVGTLVAILTKKLGAYYLIGAFVVGMVAGRMQVVNTPFNSKEMFKSLRNFASLFLPFYFFNAGLGLGLDMLSQKSLMGGVVLFFLASALRIVSVVVHRKWRLKEPVAESLPIAIALLPNLVFGLVLVQILDESFGIERDYLGSLLIYTVLVSIIPSGILRRIGKSKPLEKLSEIHV